MSIKGQMMIRQTTARESARAAILQDLDALRSLAKDWNSYGADAPSETAIQNATEAALRLHENGVDEIAVTPSADGGVNVRAVFADGRVLFEFVNDGEIGVVRVCNGERELFELTSETLRPWLESWLHGRG